MLKSLPSRLTDTAEADKEVFMIALDGVTAYGLAEATMAILRGGLGHAFHPSPPEFRMRCDAAMKPIKDEMARIERTRLEKERDAEFRPVQHTQAEIVRVNELYQSFCEGHQSDFKTEEQLIAEIRNKYPKELLDAIPDAPTGFNGPRS
ncbi:hypothetical protein LJR231_003480 [Phyllobacterium sp. LjRoot231]|uniref:hypothetical protein n=1 Tax=Phyllobacterium sp. LjRoot231 TaxID=3342289 RepID=UPI003ED13971